ncbi:MAG: redoxin domain-containing protein, partial [Prevotella sp.]
MKIIFRKIWLSVCLLAMLEGGTVTARQTDRFQEFVAKHSLSFSNKSCGRKIGTFSLKEGVSSSQFAGKPYLILFWTMDDQGKQALQRLDSLRRKGELGCSVIAVNIDAAPEAVESYAKEKRYRFPVIAGDKAVRFAKKQKVVDGSTLIVV